MRFSLPHTLLLFLLLLLLLFLFLLLPPLLFLFLHSFFLSRSYLFLPASFSPTSFPFSLQTRRSSLDGS